MHYSYATQALHETPSALLSQKRAELLEEQRIQMEEKRQKKDEAVRIARQQEFEEEQRLEVILSFMNPNPLTLKPKT